MSLAASARSPICHQTTSDSCRRDWAALDDGPAGLIADRLLAHDVADYIRFRSMCRNWRRCSPNPRAHGGLDRRFHPRQWVMLQERLLATDSPCFFNSSTGQFIQVNLPELRHHYFGGGRALFLGRDCSLLVPVGVFPSCSISSDTIYFRFDVKERDSTEAYHLAVRSIEPAILNLDGSVPRPHTLVDCLCLTFPDDQ